MSGILLCEIKIENYISRKSPNIESKKHVKSYKAQNENIKYQKKKEKYNVDYRTIQMPITINHTVPSVRFTLLRFALIYHRQHLNHNCREKKPLIAETRGAVSYSGYDYCV